MGYVVAARGAAREMMRTMGNSGAAILSKIVESIGKTAIRRAVSLLFVLGGVVVSVGLASYIWINKKLKQIEEQQDTITSKLKQIEERQNAKLDKQAKIQEDQNKIQNDQNIKFNKFEVRVDHHMQRINDVIVERDKDNSRAAISKLKEDLDQQLENMWGREHQLLVSNQENKLAETKEKMQKETKEKMQKLFKGLQLNLQTQFTQLEQNVIKNLNGTLDNRLTNLEDKQQEDIKKEMSTYYIQHLNTLEKKLMNTIEEKLTADVAKKSADLDQTLKEIWEKQNKQLEKHDKQMAEIHQAFVATMKKEFVNLYEAQSAGTRKEEHQSRTLSYAHVTAKGTKT